MYEKVTFEDIFEFTNTSIVVLNSKGCISHINHNAQLLLDLNVGVHLNKELTGILSFLKRPISDLFSTKEQIGGYQVQGPQAQLVLDLIPIFKQEQFAGAICIFEKLEKFEKSAQKTASFKTINRQLETIIDSSSDGLWVCDGKGEVISLNKASEALNGIKHDKVIGRNIQNLLDNKIFDQSVTTLVLDSGNRETIMQYVAKTKKFLLATGTPAFDENGDIALIVVNERDITELNTLRKEFEQSQKMREKYKEELSELALLELQNNTIIAESPGMRSILQMSLKLAHIGASNILILGESGTGKSMLSKLIHKNSSRRKNPFVEINCAALPESLLEVELFGYEKGAFTGANSKGKVGLFEMAHGGTLFLDEIGDMPLLLQAKLLKYLDDHEIRRVGGTDVFHVECSVIAATNQDLHELVKQKLFREDLYYRLNSFILKIPPLRERTSDISGLIRFYLEKFNTKYRCNKKINSKTMQYLLHYAFPGNVRELKSIVENVVVMDERSNIDEFVRGSLGGNESVYSNLLLAGNDSHDFNLSNALRDVEKALLIRSKKEFTTTREMAKHLGISQPSVVRKLKQHNIN